MSLSLDPGYVRRRRRRRSLSMPRRRAPLYVQRLVDHQVGQRLRFAEVAPGPWWHVAGVAGMIGLALGIAWLVGAGLGGS